MQALNIHDLLDKVLEKDTRYHRDAYLFLREALDHTHKLIDQGHSRKPRHVTGQELLNGVRDYALTQFGPMAQTVLESWGVRRCEDIGEIVFNMVDSGLLTTTPQDSREDFKGGFDFRTAFQAPFLPSVKKTATSP